MKNPLRPNAPATATLLLAATLLLSGCAAVVPLEPAADAINPGCAEVIVRVPEVVNDLDRRETNAQGSAAWGTPSAVILGCGVEVPVASTMRCVTIDGIDWLEDDTDAPRYLFTSFGREPAVQLLIDTDAVTTAGDSVAPGLVLSDLANAVSYTEPTGTACVAASEVIDGAPEGTPAATTAPGETPTPSPTASLD